MLDAAALAAILDPERTVPGWWKLAPKKCGNGSRDGVVDVFTGPQHSTPPESTAGAWRSGWRLGGCSLNVNGAEEAIEHSFAQT